MAVTVPVSFVSQFNNNLEVLCQQKGSKLRGAVSVEKVTGECAYFEQIGSVEAVKAGARSGSGYIILKHLLQICPIHVVVLIWVHGV